MLYDYLLENYEEGEPIFLSELPGNSRDYVRQEMKKLVDEGKLERLYNGVYYLSYTTILGTKGKISVDKYVDKKYLNNKSNGYITGLQLANLYGFTTQNPSCIEVCSNEATTKQRKLNIDGRDLIVYKPVTKINDENASTLQFLDLMTTIDKYSEVTGDEFKNKLNNYVEKEKIDFSLVKKYLALFPDRVYRNFYESGLMVLEREIND
mgnify:FL=1